MPKSEIIEILSPSVRVKLFKVEKPKGFSFISGQFATLSIEGLVGKEGIIVKRSYSIASSPLDSCLEFCIAKAGFFSSKLHELKEGDYLNVQGPFGTFTLNNSLPANTVFIAGGTGISPLMSMLRTMNRENSFPKNFRLFYGFNSISDFIFEEELELLAKQDKIELFASIDKPAKRWKGEVGFVSDVLERHIGFPKSDVYVCGPPLMISTTLKLLLNKGFDEKRIHREMW